MFILQHKKNGPITSIFEEIMINLRGDSPRVGCIMVGVSSSLINPGG